MKIQHTSSLSTTQPKNDKLKNNMLPIYEKDTYIYTHTGSDAQYYI